MRLIYTLLIIVVAVGVLYLYRSDTNVDGNLIKGISQIRQQFGDSTDQDDTTTKIFKYRNAKGEWVFSNEKPDDQSKIKEESVLEYRNDTNVLPAPAKKKEKKQP